ncbi:zinc finger BED domain-containing protein 5 [Nephila pilipes]|uniref:Zinc finger BED domain-containing protein 5 n=1 Tax=Nephila pilipes TaxID=299642 RepID=A0A8X6N4Z4_NEPPI|nr:zinc finger BED domain-containing protein 5 [Nephila pilipes]
MAWLSTLAYHADIFGKLNELFLVLKGKQVNILQAKDKLVAFSRKIQYRISTEEQNNFECFQTLNDFLEESEVDLDTEIRKDVFDEYPNLAKQAIRIVLLFATTYLCEVGFSKYVATKTKYRNKLDAAPDMRVHLSKLMPNFKRIVESKKQLHPLH